ncbi:MAG: peptidyl-alpha-hydroxyglycine alpha-amidating lyase family protein [Bryobacteraceae bacterium]
MSPIPASRALLALLISLPLWGQDVSKPANEFRALVRSSPHLGLEFSELTLQPAGPGWIIDFVSSAAIGRNDVFYLLQRGPKADPVLVVDGKGKILRSWGKGMYTIPHSIRIDPAGNIWTVDSGSSMVYKFTPEGKRLMEINVGEMPKRSSGGFAGATDIAFGPGGRILISDGYGNARVLEYSAEGKRLREWGTPGTGPGEFRQPHGIAIDKEGVVYVADRNNFRVQRFTMDGKYIGEWNHVGKATSITVTSKGELWVGTQPQDVANGMEQWLVRVDRKTGKVTGSLESTGAHSVDLTSKGEVLTGARPNQVVWFRAGGK